MIKINQSRLNPILSKTNEKKNSRRFSLVPELRENGTLAFGLAFCSDTDQYKEVAGVNIATHRLESGYPVVVRTLPNITRKEKLAPTIKEITASVVNEIKNNGNLFRNIVSVNNKMMKNKIKVLS